MIAVSKWSTTRQVPFSLRYSDCSDRLSLTTHTLWQAGIGTYTIPQIAKPWMAKLSKMIDMMLGIHLDAHVQGVVLCDDFMNS
jgi:hypothetical protein